MSAVRIITMTEDDLRRIIREELGARTAARPATEDRLTVPEAAKRAGVSKETIRNWIHAGRLPYSLAGREYRVLPADLEAAMQPRPADPVDMRDQTQAIIRRLRG